MANLKCTTETVINVDYGDMESFIKNETGHFYELVGSEEWGNDSQHRFSIDGKLHEYEKNDWEAFKKDGPGTKSFLLRTILNGLCSENKIIPGVYLISICW